MNHSTTVLHDLDNVLHSFEPFDLDHLKKKAPLLNRKDEKFVFSLEQLPQLLASCIESYDILEVSHQRSIAFETIYYDTKDLQFYHDHLRGRSPRFKVRHRTYGDHESYSLEIKKKIAGSRTIKYRNLIDTDIDHTVLSDYNDFLQQCPLPESTKLLPQISVQYKRITLLHKIKEEKITIDLELHCSKGSMNVSFDSLVIAEIKTSGAINSSFKQSLKKKRIHPGGISKYCLAMISTHPKLKFNTFKPILKKIQKLNSYAPYVTDRPLATMERSQ